MKTVKRIYRKLLIASVLALSLVVAAFAHRAMPVSVDGAKANGIDFEAFRLPDGSLPVFCVFSGDGDGTSGAGHDSCEFCTLAHGAGIAQVSDLTLHAKLNNCAVQLIRQRIAAQGIFLPGAPGTGPPAFS